MHVKRVAGPALCLLLAACDGPPKPSGSTLAATSVAASASASAFPLALGSSVPPDPALLALSRRALAAATALAKKCDLRGLVDGNVIEESCEWKAPEVGEMRDAASALRGAPGAPRVGPAASFAEEIRLFAEWVEVVRELRKNGTLAHYQELAAAWNAWRPDEKVAVDPVSLPRYARDGGTDGGVLVWQRCSEGPCVITGVVKPMRGD